MEDIVAFFPVACLDKAEMVLVLFFFSKAVFDSVENCLTSCSSESCQRLTNLIVLPKIERMILCINQKKGHMSYILHILKIAITYTLV